MSEECTVLCRVALSVGQIVTLDKPTIASIQTHLSQNRERGRHRSVLAPNTVVSARHEQMRVACRGSRRDVVLEFLRDGVLFGDPEA